MLPARKQLLHSMPRFFENEWDTLFDWSNRNFSKDQTTLPSVNIKEDEDSFTLEMAAPGMKKDDFQIELDNDQLTIKSERQAEEEEKEERYTRKEFSYESFQRTFNLNNQVINQSEIKAEYTDGVLRLTLPKREEAKKQPSRLIEIS